MPELKASQVTSGRVAAAGGTGVGVNRQEISNFLPIYFDIAIGCIHT